jgi:hypothetical protein
MTDLIIPDHVLASAKDLLAKELFFFGDHVSAVFKPMQMVYDDVGCYCVVTMPNGDERFFESYPALNNIVLHRVSSSIRKGKKIIPYIIDFNAIHSSIKLNHKNTYSNNLWFEYIDNNLTKIIFNQSVSQNNFNEVIYLLYSAKLSNQFKLNDSNSADFYVFHHLMENTHLKEILPEDNYFEQFKNFVKNRKSHIDLLKMYTI